jgi:hypothetical protein
MDAQGGRKILALRDLADPVAVIVLHGNTRSARAGQVDHIVIASQDC